MAEERPLQVSAKKARTLLALAGKTRGTREAREADPSSSKDKDKGMDLSDKVKEADPSNKGRDKETCLSSSTKPKDEGTPRESLKVPSTINPATHSQAGSKPREPGSGAKEVQTRAGANGGEEKVVGNKEKGERKPAEVEDVDISKGNVKTGSPGDGKKVDVELDAKKPGAVGSSDNTTPPVTTDETTKSTTNDVKIIPPATTTDKKDDVTKDEIDPTTKDETVPANDEKTGKPEGSVEKTEPLVADDGDVATPKRTTKELPISPAKHLREKVVPALGLTVPKTPKKRLDPLSIVTATGSILSPLQKVLENTEDETLMERMARLSVVDANYQPPKDVVPPAHTDSEFEFECETAPTTPKSRAGRGSFNLMLRSEVPLSDDDDFFLDCDSNASVSNFDGV